MTGDKERCIAAGMDDYITKPFRAADLLQLVAKYLEAAVPNCEAVISA